MYPEGVLFITYSLLVTRAGLQPLAASRGRGRGKAAAGSREGSVEAAAAGEGE